MQQPAGLPRRSSWPRRRSSGGGGPPAAPPCIFHLRGGCRFGSACRFSHDISGHLDAALPLHHRQQVRSRAAAGLAAAASAAGGSGGGAEALPWRFRVMSYNVLADCLAHEHAAELYTSAPRYALEWGYRGELIVREILAHRPDVVALQEVDHFRQFQEALQPHGYEGVYTKRTGDRRDGLAMFWRSDVLRPVKQRFIRFNELGLKDNVAQLLVFQRRSPGGGRASSSSRTSSEGSEGSAASGGSLSGQKRRPAGEEVAAPRGRHLRFDSSDEGEGGGGGGSNGGGKRRGGKRGGSSSAALQALPVEDAAVGMDLDCGCPSLTSLAAAAGGLQIEDATEPCSGAAASPAAAAAAAEAEEVGARLPALVVSNIHALFNPRRGDIKMGQVRTLLEQVDSLCLQQHKRSGQRAAAVICGDFNSAAGSPIYDFVRSGQLDLSQYDRRRLSGQVEAKGHHWRALQQAFLAHQAQQGQQGQQQQQQQAPPGAYGAAALGGRWQQQQQQLEQQQQQGNGTWAAADAWPGQPPELGVDAAAAALASPYANGGGWPQSPPQQVVPPYAPPATDPAATGRSRGGRGKGELRPWSADDVRAAGGSGLMQAAGEGGALLARHPLALRSAYGAVTGGEAPYSTCHDKCIACVDYVWFTPAPPAGAAWRLEPLAVLQPPPIETLDSALPSPNWPSDHIALVADFALVPAGAVAAAAAAAAEPEHSRGGAARRRGKPPA